MNRVILSALLALALSTGALANSIPVCSLVSDSPNICFFNFELQGASSLTRDATGGVFLGFQFFPPKPEETDGFFRRDIELFPGHLLTEVSSTNCLSQLLEPVSLCFKFAGGSIAVFSGGLHPVMFDTVLKGGLGGVESSTSESRTVDGTAITATLLPNLALGIANGTLSGNWHWFSIDGGTPTQTSPDGFLEIGVNVVPEPGRLGLLGTGLIALAGMAKRKLKR